MQHSFVPFVFFPVKYLKNVVYKDAPRDIVELKRKTEGASKEIDTTMCRMVFTNLLKRLVCVWRMKEIILNTYCDLKGFFFFLKYLFSLYCPFISIFLFPVPSEITFETLYIVPHIK